MRDGTTSLIAADHATPVTLLARVEVASSTANDMCEMGEGSWEVKAIRNHGVALKMKPQRIIWCSDQWRSSVRLKTGCAQLHN